MKRLLVFMTLMTASGLFATVITSGFVHVEGVSAAGRFTLVSDDFSASGNFFNGVFPTRYLEVPPGTAVPVEGHVIGGDIDPGSAVINGVAFPNLSWYTWYSRGSGLFFSGPPLVVAALGFATGSFNFTGSLCGNTDQYAQDCLIDLPVLTGSGLVTFTLRKFPPNSLPPDSVLDVAEALYVFTVPEPSTFGVFVPLLMIGAHRYRLRRRALLLAHTDREQGWITPATARSATATSSARFGRH